MHYIRPNYVLGLESRIKESDRPYILRIDSPISGGEVPAKGRCLCSVRVRRRILHMYVMC